MDLSRQYEHLTNFFPNLIPTSVFALAFLAAFHHQLSAPRPLHKCAGESCGSTWRAATIEKNLTGELSCDCRQTLSLIKSWSKGIENGCENVHRAATTFSSRGVSQKLSLRKRPATIRVLVIIGSGQLSSTAEHARKKQNPSKAPAEKETGLSCKLMIVLESAASI